MDRDAFSGKNVQVDHYIYGNGEEEIELFKQNGVDHVWLEGNSERI